MLLTKALANDWMLEIQYTHSTTSAQMLLYVFVRWFLRWNAVRCASSTSIRGRKKNVYNHLFTPHIDTMCLIGSRSLSQHHRRHTEKINSPIKDANKLIGRFESATWNGIEQKAKPSATGCQITANRFSYATIETSERTNGEKIIQ